MKRATWAVTAGLLFSGCAAASTPSPEDIAVAAPCDGGDAVPILEVRNVLCEADAQAPASARCAYEVRQAFTREVGFLGAQWRRESKLFSKTDREDGAGSRWCHQAGSTQR